MLLFGNILFLEREIEMRVATIFLMLCLSASGALAEGRTRAPLDRGYWVIVGSFPLEPVSKKIGIDRFNAVGNKCHLNVYNDFSGKFNFKPGYQVFVLSDNTEESNGIFATSAEAQRKANSVRRCFPDAYVKYGIEPGE